MLLTKSVVAFARVADEVARTRLPKYRTKFSKHDFDWPQLVACLLVRQFQRLDYRGTETMLREHAELRKALRLEGRVPDHTALCRALGAIDDEVIGKLLDETISRMVFLQRAGTKAKTVITDSTGMRWDQLSRTLFHKKKKILKRRRFPKWSIGIDMESHAILSQVVDIGPCSDHREFEELMEQAQRRRPSEEWLGDAGYDSVKNVHACVERWKLNPIVRISLRTNDPAKICDPLRRALFVSRPKRYGQRWQVESTFSAHKRRFTDIIRSRSTVRRDRELLLRGVLHNCAILRSLGWHQLRIATEQTAFTSAG